MGKAGFLAFLATSHHIFEESVADFSEITSESPKSGKTQKYAGVDKLHFTDMCLLLYYGNTRSTKMRVYQLAQDILDHRTQGYWIDPERCGKAVPENIVTELLDPKIPLKALLENPEKKAVLTQIDMPSRAWFYGYARYIESTADAGQQLITQRLGKGIWEQYHLVFDTFVRRAQLPLQYVFADHWLVNAWIVDDETRSQTSRLWLTVLIDAYSRS